MKQEFTIEGTLSGLNEYTEACGSRYMSGARLKRENQDIVCWAIKAARLKPMKTPVAVSILWVEGMRPGRKRFVPRDRDNIRFAAKFILDALQDCGIIKTDSWADVASLSDKFQLNRNNPKIVVTIEEIGR